MSCLERTLEEAHSDVSILARLELTLIDFKSIKVDVLLRFYKLRRQGAIHRIFMRHVFKIKLTF